MTEEGDGAAPYNPVTKENIKKNMGKKQGPHLVYIFDWSYVLFTTGGLLLP